jgi:hypothetical protein
MELQTKLGCFLEREQYQPTFSYPVPTPHDPRQPRNPGAHHAHGRRGVKYYHQIEVAKQAERFLVK